MLFDDELSKDESPIEPVNITYLQLYYSTDEMEEFKKLAKAGMIKMFPENFHDQNISDFIFNLIKLYNA